MLIYQRSVFYWASRETRKEMGEKEYTSGSISELVGVEQVLCIKPNQARLIFLFVLCVILVRNRTYSSRPSACLLNILSLLHGEDGSCHVCTDKPGWCMVNYVNYCTREGKCIEVQYFSDEGNNCEVQRAVESRRAIMLHKVFSCTPESTVYCLFLENTQT